MELSEGHKFWIVAGIVIVAIVSGLLLSHYAVTAADDSAAVETIEIDGTQTLIIQLTETADIVDAGTQVAVLDADGERVFATELAPGERTLSERIEPGTYTLALSNGESHETVEFTVEPRFI